VLKGEFMQNRSTWIWAGGKSALSLAPHRLAQPDDFFREVGDERLGLGIGRAEFTLSGFSHAIGPIGKSAGAKTSSNYEHAQLVLGGQSVRRCRRRRVHCG
jgi:hypothetical protein